MSLARKIFIIAGEASGDLHGKNLVKALFEKDANLSIHAYGGPKMAAAGATIVRSYIDYAFMGFFEVAKNIRKVMANLNITEEIILKFQPEVIVFIDFPGFNLRIAGRLRKKLPDTLFVYYITPQVWAWKANRVHRIHQLFDRIFVILPFEKAFFDKFGYEVNYVGHPLLDEIGAFSEAEKIPGLVALLPGSRRQEISKMLPIFLALAKSRSDYHFEISTMPDIPLTFYKSLMGTFSDKINVRFCTDTTYELLARASSAIVTSGTATLEAALFNTPQIVAYKTSKLSYEIAKRVVKVEHISLVNLIMNEQVIEELIQDDLNLKNLIKSFDQLQNPVTRAEINSKYHQLKTLLGKTGASEQVADSILFSGIKKS